MKTNEFKHLIPENSYRSQICQHAAALGLDYILMVYSAPGALPKKMVLVCIGADQRYVLCKLQYVLASKFMAFACTQNSGSIPSLGDDNSPVYGYAQEHHTVELWLNIWKEHTKNVQQYGTPPPCRRLLDLSTSFWNKCMGNVDTVRKIVKNV